MKKYFPQRDFKIMPKLGHDSLGLLNLELFKEMIGGLYNFEAEIVQLQIRSAVWYPSIGEQLLFK